MTETTVTETEIADAGAERPRETRPEKIRTGLEALLFSSPRPVSEKDLADVLDATREAVASALATLAEEADRADRGVRLEKVAGGWRYVTRPEFDSLLRRFHEVSERSRLSLAALETLAIIAYRQPITLPEIQEIRGVNSSSVLKTLFEKKLVTTAGKKAVVGTPFLYRTTPEFLVRFGLNELEELPRPEEIEEDLAATLPEERTPELPVPTAADFRSSHPDEDLDLPTQPIPAPTPPAAALAPLRGPDDDEEDEDDEEDLADERDEEDEELDDEEAFDEEEEDFDDDDEDDDLDGEELDGDGDEDETEDDDEDEDDDDSEDEEADDQPRRRK
jgi:segregation and condensation protein B